MPEKQAVHKFIIYYPPSQEVIDRFARDVCLHMAQRVDVVFNTPEMIRGFSAFIKIVACIYAKHLTNHPNNITKFDN